MRAHPVWGPKEVVTMLVPDRSWADQGCCVGRLTRIELALSAWELSRFSQIRPA
jgi:hypothetical protein